MCIRDRYQRRVHGPKKFSKFFRIDSLNASWTAKKDLLVPKETEEKIRMFERPAAEPLPILSINGEYEAKFSFGKKLFNDLKITWNHHSLPKLNASMLYHWSSAFLGATIALNNQAFKKVEFLEFMFGVNFNKACLAYVKHSRNDIRDMGKIAFGLYLLSKLKKGNSKAKEDRPEIAVGGEASLDLKDRKLHYEVGTKMTIPEKKVEVQLKMNEMMDCCSSLAITPKKGVRLMWSEGLNLAGLFTSPSAANYKYGFSMEMDFDALLQDLTAKPNTCLLYTSPSPRDLSTSRMPSSA
eukprot:TRINITY_DN1975_c0_g1_i2.p1 TRINITY_DN1975_c0_g1~~TRINITY_DN1975_c0_g1_i2.p1  ORF type:complete len:296 (+),score=59.99 TRINITY_DN1975_c0_g1_i2:177-1064(+)